MKTIKLGALVSVLAGLVLAFAVVPAWAEKDITEPTVLVLEAQKALKDFVSDPDMTWFRDNVNKAKAILIIPRMIKAGFIFGGTGGSGTLLGRDEKTGTWSYPAFYSMGSVSFGLQIGGSVDQVMLLVMSKKGMDKLLTSSFKLGGDISVAAGPVGVGTGVKGVTADVLAFSRSKGVFGGLTIEGAVVAPRDKWNSAYYGKSVRPTDILILRNVSNKQANGLRKELKKTAK
ncbi:MAG: lipid-binding SYLF domain-containing protein [Thermodesulfobacteriota bacterium]|nr:lipid-binding SYLF domain-containing protein [Thermodesulfobacteriota bacterium]